MANYNVKYKGQFRDVDNTLWTVDILKDENVSEVEEITLADPPVTIEYQQEDVYQPLKCSAATIRVLTPKILDIYTGKIDVKIQIYRNHTLFWEGWNTPNVYSSEYSTNLDLIEINAIDNIAALDYSKYKCKKQTDVLTYSIQDFITALGNSISSEWIGFPHMGGIEINKIKVGRNVQENDYNIRFTLTYNGEEIVGDIVSTIDIQNSVSIFNLDLPTDFPISVVYSVASNSIIFNATELYDITEYPYTQKRTEYNPEKVTIFDILTRLVDKEINFYSENDLDIEDMYINENIFLDEDGEPVTNKEVLKQINMYLGTTMFQWGGLYGCTYNMIDLVNYHKALLCGYKTTFKVYNSVRTSFDTFLSIPEMVVSEDESQISYGDIYNQITVQAKLDIDDSDKAASLYDNLTYFKTETATTTNNKYEAITSQASQLLNTNTYLPSEETTTFDENFNVETMDSRITNSIQYVDESTGYNRNLIHPHPSYSEYYKYYCKNPIWNTKFPAISLKQAAVNMYIYRQPQECFQFTSGKVININGSSVSKNLVIGGQVYLANPNEIAPYITPESSTKYTGAVGQNGEGIINFLWAKVQIGEKYWNGFLWTTTPTWITIGLGGEETTDTDIKNDVWYSISNTTRPKSKLNGWNIPLTLGAYLNGEITVTLGIPQFRKMGLPYSTSSSSGFDEKKWDEWRSIRNTSSKKYGSVGAEFTNLGISAIYIKDFSLKIESTDYNEDLSTSDITYSQELDNTLVQSKDDITMLLNSYEPYMNKDMSSSYVLFNHGVQYVQSIYNYGLIIKPEQHLVHKYCNYYAKPKLIATNKFFMNQVEPLDLIKIPYLDGYYLVGDIEYDLRYKQVKITAYEF